MAGGDSVSTAGQKIKKRYQSNASIRLSVRLQTQLRSLRFSLMLFVLQQGRGKSEMLVLRDGDRVLHSVGRCRRLQISALHETARRHSSRQEVLQQFLNISHQTDANFGTSQRHTYILLQLLNSKKMKGLDKKSV